jgi:hypothetical protein
MQMPTTTALAELTADCPEDLYEMKGAGNALAEDVETLLRGVVATGDPIFANRVAAIIPSLPASLRQYRMTENMIFP